MCIKDNTCPFTHRKPVIHHSMAMVAAISPGCIQAHDDLVPPLSLAQVLWKASQSTFGQPLQLLIDFSPLLVGENTFHPKHDSDLDLQGQHATKRLVLRIHQPTTIHFNTTSSWQLTSLQRGAFLIFSYPPITDSR